MTTLNLSSANIFLNAGDTFSIIIDTIIGFGFNTADLGDPYTRGVFEISFDNGTTYFPYAGDLAFRTYMDTSAQSAGVPAPGALVLFGLGLAGLAAQRRNKG